jgi:ABC-2 type transport system permease protein
MSARRALLVASRDYVENIKTKGFWIGILSVPALIVLSVVIPVVLERAKDARRYAVLDRSGWLLAAVEERAVGDDARKLLQFLRKKASEGDSALEGVTQPVRELAAAVKDATDEQIDAVAAEFGGRPSLGADPLTPQLRARLDLVKDDVRLWMISLDPEQARATGASLDRGRYQRVEVPAGTPDPEAWLRDQLAKAPEKGGLFAYFVIGDDPVAGSEGSKYVSRNFADTDLRDWFGRIASEIVEERRFAHEGVASDAARRIKEPLRFEQKQITDGEETAVSGKDKARQWAPVAFVYLLWSTVLMTASSLLTNTVEEKSNKLIEVLLSSVSPLEMLSGKILGTAATGLTLVGAWMACFVFTLALVPKPAGGGFSLSALASDPFFLASFVVYYLLGYLFYAAILVALGSVCDSMKDAQSLFTPVMIVMALPLAAMVFVVRDPNGTLAKVISWFPPFTPFVMMNRAAGPPSAWEYAGTTALLVLSVVVAFWMSAKIFRVGILMTGKPPKLREILRWVRAPVGATPARKE